MNSPAEVQILVVQDHGDIDFSGTLVPVMRVRCRECDIRKILPALQARAFATAHNKQFHPPRHRADPEEHATIPNPDHTPLGKYEVID